jgi:hypothetical protein
VDELHSSVMWGDNPPISGVVPALLLISSWTSIGWQASGMENPLFVACAFVVVAAAAVRTSTPLATTTLVTSLSALGPGCPMDGRLTVWHQRANKELALTGEILSSTTPNGVVASALAECDASSDDPFRCEAVMRAVWRSLDELAQRGELPGVMFAMNASPSRDLNLLLLERPAGWADRALAVFSDMADSAGTGSG